QEEGVRETSRLLPRVSSSEAPSSIDAKSQRDLEVMKACHDFDLTVTEGSLVAIWKRYSIPGSTHCVSVGKSAPVGQATSSLPEVEEVHMEIAPRMSLTLTPKRLAKKSAPQQEDSVRNVGSMAKPEEFSTAEQRVVAAEQWVTDLQADNEKLMAQLVEATHRLEFSDKELNDIQVDLSDVQ
ncbi:hypothetical protein BHE74_00033456, partial [Ensete ventricosum]